MALPPRVLAGLCEAKLQRANLVRFRHSLRFRGTASAKRRTLFDARKMHGAKNGRKHSAGNWRPDGRAEELLAARAAGGALQDASMPSPDSARALAGEMVRR